MLGVLGEQARAFTQGDGAPGLADGDLRAKQAGAVFALQGNQVPAAVQDRDGQGCSADFTTDGKGLPGQVNGDFQG